ncbi:MAG: nucleotidyl transferase AbiEii/AbiGii toxin family protein [Bacteroidales bacterium]|nr:nucleotidyl transferase AbiEii/AbiGii toxin family protein [Bacteroidales bacterium]
MLYYETIEPNTPELLKALQCTPEFKALRLVGGTALALQIGHRRSIDIDLFGKLEADDFELANILNNIGKTINLKKYRLGVVGTIILSRNRKLTRIS